MEKVVISVLGKDTVGIIAKICTNLAANKVNVLDISQTILDGLFNMMMIVDIAGCDKDLATIQEELDTIGSELGVNIKAQRTEIFEKMHRI